MGLMIFHVWFCRLWLLSKMSLSLFLIDRLACLCIGLFTLLRYFQVFGIFTRAVPDFGSDSGQNPVLFPNPAKIRLRQKSHRRQIVLPDLKSWRVEEIYSIFLLVWHMKNSLEFWMLDDLDISCLHSTYWLHYCGINYCASACKWCNGNSCTKNNQKLFESLVCL